MIIRHSLYFYFWNTSIINFHDSLRQMRQRTHCANYYWRQLAHQMVFGLSHYRTVILTRSQIHYKYTLIWHHPVCKVFYASYYSFVKLLQPIFKTIGQYLRLTQLIKSTHTHVLKEIYLQSAPRAKHEKKKNQVVCEFYIAVQNGYGNRDYRMLLYHKLYQQWQ